MKTNALTLRDLNQACFLTVIDFFNRYQYLNTGISVVTTECTTPILVPELRKKVKNLPMKKTQSISVQKVASRRFLTERVWGLKIGDKVVFDLEKYSLRDLLYIALNMPMAKIFSDVEIDYYTDGKRVMRKAEPIALVNKFRIPPLMGYKQLTRNEAEYLFSKQVVCAICDDDNKDTMFLADTANKNLILAMDEKYDVYLPFNCMLQENSISGYKLDTNLAIDGNFMQVFAAFAEGLKKGANELLASDETLNTFRHVTYVPTKKGTLEPKLVTYKFMVGFADLSFDEAKHLLSDTERLKANKLYCAGQRAFSVTEDGKLLNNKEVVTSKFNDAANPVQIILAPVSAYLNLGRPISSEWQNHLGRSRNFKYEAPTRYSKDRETIVKNLSGEDVSLTRGCQCQNLSAELQRLLALPLAGYTTVDGVNVEELGQAVLDGRLTLEGIGKRFNKIAQLIEDVVQTTTVVDEYGSPHYSSPQRVNLLTGRLSGYEYDKSVTRGH